MIVLHDAVAFGTAPVVIHSFREAKHELAAGPVGELGFDAAEAAAHFATPHSFPPKHHSSASRRSISDFSSFAGITISGCCS